MGREQPLAGDCAKRECQSLATLSSRLTLRRLARSAAPTAQRSLSLLPGPLVAKRNPPYKDRNSDEALARIRERISSASEITLVAKENGKVVGVCRVIRREDKDVMRSMSYQNISVLASAVQFGVK